MQDIYTTTECGGGGRFSGGGDRRLRPNHHHHNQQAPKCPRCESPNTKFCYYNNYNLSQPRHFCKSCRRYWTKGGVLRNVPVGGGCRKSKRSKTKSTAGSSPEHKSSSKSNYDSNSESSTVTATISTVPEPAPEKTSGEATTGIVSATSSNFASNSLNFPESSFFLHHSMNPSFDQLTLTNNNSTENQIFRDIGNFNTVMTSSNDPPTTGFSMTDIPAYRRDPNPEQWQPKMVWSTKPADDQHMQEIGSGFLDPTGRVDVSSLQQSRANTNELASSDWQIGGAGGGGGGGGGVEHGLFDLTGSFDHSYWGQTQWVENDHTLNCLP